MAAVLSTLERSVLKHAVLAFGPVWMNPEIAKKFVAMGLVEKKTGGYVKKTEKGVKSFEKAVLAGFIPGWGVCKTCKRIEAVHGFEECECEMCGESRAS